MMIDVDSRGGWRHMTEGSIASLGPYPGTSDKSWSEWQCIPMYNHDGDASITIITHGNANCQAMLTRANDGCSSPVWSAYTWAFTPACQRHDICKYQYHVMVQNLLCGPRLNITHRSIFMQVIGFPSTMIQLIGLKL